MLAACQRGQQDFLSAKFTDGPSECRDSEARRVVTPPCTDERPRASGVSGGQSRQAFTRGSPRSRMRTCSLRRTSQDPGRALGELPSLGEGSLRPQPRARTTKDTGTQGCSRCDGHHSQPVPPCPARRTPTLRRFTPSQTRRVDGALSRTVARGAWTDKRYERGRPCSALLLRGAPVPPVVRWARPCAGEGSPRRTHASSTALETVRHAVSGAPTASPRQLPARGRALSPWSRWWVVVGRRPPGTLSSIRPASSLR